MMNRKRRIDPQIDMLIRRARHAAAAERRCMVRPVPVPVPNPTSTDPIAVPPCVTLFPHQERVVRRMLNPGGDRGMLVCHSMGSGKTLLALATGYALKDASVIDRLVIIAPNSVQDYWTGNVERLGMAESASVFTHHSFPPDAVNDRTLLVVDEAHNFRTPIGKDKPFESQKAYRMLVAASAARKVLLLSGTPIVNVEEDVKNIVCAIRGGGFHYEAYKSFKPGMKHVWPLTDFHRVDVSDPRLPSCTVRREVFTMPPPFMAWYKRVEDDVREAMGSSRNLKMFMNGVRRAVNGCSWSCSSDISRRSPKIDWLRELVATCMDKREKVMIYSAWKSFGVKNVSEALRDRRPDIAVGVIDGEMSTTSRANTVAGFNAGQLHVLMVTAAGSEGIDLKGTRHVVILEPHWNPSRTDQAIGRACRINSHAALPEEERNVTVYKLILQKPQEICNDYESADVLLEKKSLEKKDLCNAFMRPE